MNYLLHKIAHAAAGCVAGAIQKSCEAGATEAAVGEIVAGQLNDGTKILTNTEKEKIIGQSKLVAGVVAAYTGYDVDTSRIIGIDSKDPTGPKQTKFITLITDKKGNLVNTFLGKTVYLGDSICLQCIFLM